MFLGKLGLLESKFRRTEALKSVWEYLVGVIYVDSESYLRVMGLKEEEINRVDLGGGIFAIEQCYETKLAKEAFFESHLQMVDFQLVLEGREVFFVAPRSVCVPKDLPQKHREENLQKDLVEYSPCSLASSVLLFDGMLAVFEKDDVHAGGIVFGQKSLIKKTVVKVPRQLLQMGF